MEMKKQGNQETKNMTLKGEGEKKKKGKHEDNEQKKRMN